MLDIISAIRHSRAEVPVGLMPTSKDSALSESSRGGQIEVYRSLDDMETLIEHGRPQDILGHTPTAANDNQLAWPFIPFPENLLV